MKRKRFDPNQTAMKTVIFRKSKDFSSNSKVILHLGNDKTHIRGFGSYSFSIEPNQELFASQQWVRSEVISYATVNDNTTYLIKPKLDKLLAIITLIVFFVCAIVFLTTKSRWSFIPILPIALYVIVYLTILKNKYLIITPDQVTGTK